MELDHEASLNNSPGPARKDSGKAAISQPINQSFDDENVDQSQDIANRVKFQYQDDDTDGGTMMDASEKDARGSETKFEPQPQQVVPNFDDQSDVQQEEE